MESEGPERRLAAILSADAVGYSRLMAEDEERTLRTLTAYREQLAVLVRQHRGRVVDAPGDNLLAEFPSALDATRCALEIQKIVGARNDALPAGHRMPFRIGVHLGDVMVEGERIYGDGVNLAARLEGLAEPGGVCISGTVHEQVRDKLAAGFADLGEQAVKNHPHPLRAYRIAPRGASVPVVGPGRRRGRTALAAAAALLLLAAGGLWASWPRPLGWLLDWTGAGAAPVEPPLPDKPSIVVLPFEDLGGDPEQEYFADGITEDLTTELSRNEGLFVIARNSAFTYKGRAIRVEDVARELGVRYVLEGSVRRAGNRIRITAQLIDATSGFHLWSERYDRELADVFALQSELAEKIQTALRVEIRDAELARARRIGTGDVNAWEALMRGLFHFERIRRDEALEARRWFARAFELDPEFASAYAMYGNTYALEYTMGWNRDPAQLEQAETWARRAIELGSRSADAFNTLGNVHLARGEIEAAVSSFERAVAAEPNHDIPHLLRGVALASRGSLLPALESIARALRLNPKGTPAQRMVVGFVNYRAGRTAEAVELMEAARAENPDLILPRLLLIVHRDSQGDSEEARSLAGEVLRANPELTAAEADRMLLAQSGSEEVFRRAGLP